MAEHDHGEHLTGLAGAMLDMSPLPLLLLDETLRIVAASRSFYGQFRTTVQATIGHSLAETGSGAWVTPQVRTLLELVQSDQGRIDGYDMDLVCPNVAIRRLRLNAHKVATGDERHDWILLTIEDLTAARRLDQQKDALLVEKDVLLREKDTLLNERRILLEEVQHRVANSLQIIASILMLKARAVQSEESRRHLEDAHQRVISIAAIQSQLQVGVEDVAVGPYLTKLCESLSSSMISDPRAINLAVEADGSSINARDAVSVGLVVTELVINAIKYGFPKGKSGNIVVSYRKQALGWTLAVKDNGVGLSTTSRTAGGLGSSLVAALAVQLGCVVARDDAGPGLRVSIVHGGADHAEPVDEISVGRGRRRIAEVGHG
jgi:chemotaxis protein methyltransferase CheR